MMGNRKESCAHHGACTSRSLGLDGSEDIARRPADTALGLSAAGR